MRENARLRNDASVGEFADISGDSVLAGRSEVLGKARVSGSATLLDRAEVHGNAKVSGITLSGNVFIAGEATLTSAQDLLCIGPIGSESVTMVLARTASGHQLSVGCWASGTVDDLLTEVARRARDWDADASTVLRWHAEYEAGATLLEARVQSWTMADQAATLQAETSRQISAGVDVSCGVEQR